MADTPIEVGTGSLGFEGHGADGGIVITGGGHPAKSGWGVGLSFQGQPITLNLGLNVGAPDELAFTGYAPLVNLGIIAGSPDSLAFTGYAPLVSLGVNVGSPDSLAFTGYAPLVSLGVNVGTDSLAFSSDPVTVNIVVNKLVPVGSASFTGYQPTVVRTKYENHPVTRLGPGGGPRAATYAPDLEEALTTGSLGFTGQPVTILRTGHPSNTQASTDRIVNINACDYSGFQQLPGSLKMTWNKYAVRKKSYDERHPQIEGKIKYRSSEGKRKLQRPEQDDSFISTDVSPEDF